MILRTLRTLAGIGALSAAAVLPACGPRSSAVLFSAVRRSAPAPALPTLIRPARYVATDDAAVSFDDAGRPSELPRPEPALLDGTRIRMERGVILASHPFPDYLSGFSSLPERLGGGFIFWSGDRSYRAKDFSGELVAVADVASLGGVRPWFHSAILRTELGILELDPASGAVRRLDLAGIADMRAQDARRALRVDQLGRAAFTTDAGTHWTDILATQAVAASGIGVGDGGELFVLGPTAPELVLDPAGHLVRWSLHSPRGRPTENVPSEGGPRVDWPSDFTPIPARSSMTLSDNAAAAVFAGALLPGDRMLVVREKALSILSAGNAEPLAVAELLGVSEDNARCQPVMAGPWGKRPEADVLLACTHERGAHVLLLDKSLAAPKLEATFPEPGGFVAGLSGRFGFAGRCGTDPPTAMDLHNPDGSGGALPAAVEEAPDQSDDPEPRPDGSAYFCVRAGRGDWVERRLSGDEARHVYRFLPGDDGAVTALILKAAASGAASAASAPVEGIRVVRVDPGDPALHGGRFPPIARVRAELPYRLIEPDYWLDERDGSIRGWVLLPDSDRQGAHRDKPLRRRALERAVSPAGDGGSGDDPDGDEDNPGEDEPNGGEDKPIEDKPSGGKDNPAGERSESSAGRLGRRAAGVRISPAGGIDVYPLPEGVVAVVRGGPFALALAETNGADVVHETTDGGRTWHPVEGPPGMGMWAAAGADELSGCSAAGCIWGGGVVRLGWDSPDKPSPPRAASSAATAAPSGFRVQRPSPIVLRCHINGSSEPHRSGRAKDSQASITLVSAPAPLGTIRQGVWTAEVALPFGRPPSRRIALRNLSLDGLSGVAVPLLTGSSPAPVDVTLLGRTDTGAESPGFRIGPGNTVHGWDYAGRIDVMAEHSGGALVAFDAEHSTIVLARGDAVQPIFRLTRVPDVSRTSLTLARRIDAAGLALAGVSRTSGDIFTGPLDLARGEVGPLVAAGRLSALTPGDAAVCRAPARKGPIYRMLSDVSLSLSLSVPGEKIAEPSMRGAALLLAMPERVCLEGLILQVPGKEGMSLSVQAAGAAVLRDATGAQRAQCDVVVPGP